MLALRIGINYLGYYGRSDTAEASTEFGVRRPAAALLAQNTKYASNKAVAGHRTPKRSLTPSKRLFMIASHACQIGFYNY